MSENPRIEKPDYGVDGSPYRVPLITAGAWALALFPPGISNPLLRRIWEIPFLAFALFLTFTAVRFFLYVRGGKLRLRDRLLSMVDWKGNEKVLDVGTGRGLLMIGAARKLTTGRSVGIDIWSQVDMHRNNPRDTLQNAQREGVADKVEIRSEDVQKMAFPDASFDVVLSNLCIHNIPSKEGRAQACREIARVLKPGGTAVLADILHLKAYAEVFRGEGMSAEILGGRLFETVTPWHKILKASKSRQNPV